MPTNTMWAQRLELKYFRGIRSLALDFDKNITVLVGVNGVGKTSILEALRILLSVLTTDILDELHDVRFDVSKAARKPSLPTKADIFVGQEDMSLSFEAHIKNKPLSWSVRTHSPLHVGIVKTTIEPHNTETRDFAKELAQANVADTEIELPLAVYYSLGRGSDWGNPWSNVEDEKPPNQLSAYEGALSGAGISSISQFTSWFRRLEDYENEKRIEEPTFRDKQLQAVRRVVEELLPDFSVLRIRRQPLRMVIRKGATELDIMQLSDGERYLLTLGADIARRLALSNPLAEEARLCSAVILIDEIETHLHPSWQRRVVPALARAFPNCQFIIATHSPQVLSEIRPESIYVLTQKDGEISVSHPEASFGRDSNRILEDLMGVDERPSEIKEKLGDYFHLLDQGRMEEAQLLRQSLEARIGSSEPEFTRADVLVHTRELLSK